MLFSGLVVAFMQRVCLSMAITQMVNAPNRSAILDSTGNNQEAYCPANPIELPDNSSINIVPIELVRTYSDIVFVPLFDSQQLQIFKIGRSLQQI